MNILCAKIDDNGFYVEDVLVDFQELGKLSDVVDVAIPEGMIKPFWNGAGWEEKGELTPPDAFSLPSIAERLKVLEDTVLSLLETNLDDIESE